ncbi:MAG: hypothetical protein AB7L76_15290 [Burkholderiaceae bacterium]
MPLRSAFAASIAAPRRRRVLAVGLAALLSLAGAGAASGQPGYGRMDPAEREQLRRELRERGAEGRRGGEAPQRMAPHDPRDRGPRMSPEDREQLRRQLREAQAEERGRRRRD